MPAHAPLPAQARAAATQARARLGTLEPVVLDSRSLPRQLAQRIRALIEDRSLPAGAQLPTEAELADRFRVGRTTVREALKELENEGVVVVRRGRGRFVSSTPTLRRPITRLESVTAMLASHGYDVTNRVLSVQTCPATDEEREQLRLGEGDRVVRLVRLRLHGSDPLIYSVDVLPRAPLGDLDGVDWNGSLLELLGERVGTPASAIATIRAATLPPGAALASGLDPGLPFLLMVQLNLSDTGWPMVYSHDYHRGDRFSFDLVRRAETGGGR
jgi:GntR family transcriptional regulator